MRATITGTSGPSYPIWDARAELANLRRLNLPMPAETPRFNSFSNPIGPSPARGWFLIRRKNLNSLGLNSTYTISLKDDSNRPITLRNLIISREPQNVLSGEAGDEDAVYLVEFADNRHLLNDPFIGVAVNKQFNIRAAGYNGTSPLCWYLDSMAQTTIVDGGDGITNVQTTMGVAASTYFPGSGNFYVLVDSEVIQVQGGHGTTTFDPTVRAQLSTTGAAHSEGATVYSEWTWQTMVTWLWNTCGLLGTSYTLPWTPHGTPEGWKFPGQSAYQALNVVLHRIGCAIAWNPEATSNAYSIVRVGAADTGADAALTAAENANRLIYDRQYLEIVKGKLPRTVRVYFNKRWENYGNENTTIKTASQWSTLTPYSVDITGPDTSNTDSSTVHHIWDDLPALYDPTDALTNSSALNTRAQERSDDFFRMLRDDGGERKHQIYDGVVMEGSAAIQPGSNIKGVTWRQDLGGIITRRPGSLVTEIIRHPWWMLRVNEHPAGPFFCCCEWVTDNQRPDFAPSYPIYPHLFQKILLSTGTADGSGRFTATVERYNPSARTWSSQESCYAVEHNGATTLTTSKRYDGRLSGFDTDRPVYTISGATGSTMSATLTVEEVDGSPSVTNVHTIRFDQADGFVVTSPATNIARVDLPLDLDMGAKAPETATQTVTAGNTAALTANDTEEWDTHSFHDTGSNTSRITFATGGDGRYLVCYTVKADATFSADNAPFSVDTWAKYKGATEITQSRDCGTMSRITAKIGTVETTITYSHLCFHGAFLINIADSANDYIEIFGDASASPIDIVFDDFVFSVHKLNRAGAVSA